MPSRYARLKQQLQQHWRTFTSEPVGQRFERHFERQQELDAQRSKFYLVGRAVLGIGAFVVGIVLTFIPGPAIVFFVLAAAIFASHSLKMARLLDRANVQAERLWQIARAKWRQLRRPSDA